MSKWNSIGLELSDDSDGDKEDPEQAFMKVAPEDYYSQLMLGVVL